MTENRPPKFTRSQLFTIKKAYQEQIGLCKIGAALGVSPRAVKGALVRCKIPVMPPGSNPRPVDPIKARELIETLARSRDQINRCNSIGGKGEKFREAKRAPLCDRCSWQMFMNHRIHQWFCTNCRAVKPVNKEK